MKPALTHIALHVRDLQASIAFYEDFCGLQQVHDRSDGEEQSVAWLAEPGRAHHFVFVLISGGPVRRVEGNDFSHLGFALASQAQVDAVAERGQHAGCLAWEPCSEPYPVGYYCGLKDPDGNFVEFSYGQPLGPGAPGLDEGRVGEEVV